MPANTPTSKAVLVVDNGELVSDGAACFLGSEGYSVLTARTLFAAMCAYDQTSPKVVLLGAMASPQEAHDFVDHVQARVQSLTSGMGEVTMLHLVHRDAAEEPGGFVVNGPGIKYEQVGSALFDLLRLLDEAS